MAVVIHADAELVAIVHLREALGDLVGLVCSELPGPDDLDTRLPIIQVVALPSPPSDRRVHDIARLQVITRVPEESQRPGAIALAGLVGAHFADLAGRTVALPAVDFTPAGTVTVSTVRRQSRPSELPDPNEGVIAMAFTGELYLRPLRPS